MDARLAKIESKKESSFIDSIASYTNVPHGYCIGLTDADMENHWKWSDGSSMGPYTNWGTNEPNNNNGEGCVTFFRESWYDYSCSLKIVFICEK